MKCKILFATVSILMIPFSILSSQDKKNDQKVKIVINDGSGSKVLIDTVFNNNDNKGPDSLKLKDGSFVYLNHSDNDKGKDHIIVTYSSDGSENGGEYKEVTVISSDSTNGDGKVKYYSNSKSSSNSSSSSDNHHKKYKIITKNSQDSGDTFDVYVNKSDNDSTINRTKYVIAKDGMVVTVEGNDEVKAKELVKEIENKLGVNNEDNKKKQK